MSKKKIILPELSKSISLRKSGYKAKDSDQKRRSSLKKASKKHGELAVLRRLNLIRNYNINSEVEPILSKDVLYLSNLHKQNSKNNKSKESTSKKKSKTGSKRKSKTLSKKRTMKK